MKEEIVKRKKRTAKYSGSCVYVVPGFVVKLLGSTFTSDWMRTGELFEVIEVVRRYGTVDKGKTRQRPIIYLRGLKTGKIEFCDNGFVVEVIERRTLPVGLPENYFRNLVYEWDTFYEKKGRGVWTGNLGNMIAAVMATLPMRLPRPTCDIDRLCELYMKQRAGFIGVPDFGDLEDLRDDPRVTVHIKPFRQWVRKNASRLMVTVTELEERATERETRYEQDYWNGLEADEKLIEEKFPEEGNEAVIPSCPMEG
jgi:hypothetical protein